MKNGTLATAFLCLSSLAYGSSACTSGPLTGYINGGSFYSCTEGGGALTVEFNHDLLPSYVGLNLLSLNNSAADPAAINVVPGTFGLDFDSSSFVENSSLLSSQAELVHFLLSSGTDDITATKLMLDNASTSAGITGLGTGLIVGQELVCVGGAFTSLPVGLVTSVANGLLSTGAFGCNGTALVGTAAVSSGPLNAITGLLTLPNLTGLTDSATIQLSPVNQQEIDVIKLQALLSVGGGTASDTGFGNTYTLTPTAAGASTPEPGSMVLMLCAGVLLAGNRVIGRGLSRLHGALMRVRQ